jgi:hypothetical protein
LENVRVPRFVTHYHLPGTAPFLNLSVLGDDDLALVLSALDRRREAGEHQRVFGGRYMELRRRTEEAMYDLFREVGGAPQRTAPHYFVLGVSRWYRGLAPGMQAVTVPLSELPSEVTSFTYPDSFTAMGLIAEYGLPYEPRPYHLRVFRLEELTHIVGVHGLPRDEEPLEYAGYERAQFEKYIEVQVWSDEPVRQFLAHITS